MKEKLIPPPCSEWAERLATMRLATFSEADNTLLQAHLATCDTCSAVMRDYDEFDTLIDSIQCVQPLIGLPPQLLRLWAEQDASIASTHVREQCIPNYSLSWTTRERSLAAMNIATQKEPEYMSIATLVKNGNREMQKYRNREASDDRYYLELLRRALTEHNDTAWEALYIYFVEYVRMWFRRHQHRDAALRHESEQSYVDDTFKRFWQWANNQKLEFSTLSSAIASLHLCLNSAIMDTLRAYSRPKEEPLPDTVHLNNPKIVAEDVYHEDDWWPIIVDILKNKREQRIIFLLYHCGLKPKAIMQQLPEEFASEQEIYRLTRNALDRLRRNGAQLRWKLSDD